MRLLLWYVWLKTPQTWSYTGCIYARKKAGKVRIFLGFTGTLSSPAGGCNMAQQQSGHVCELGTTFQLWNVIPQQGLLSWWGVCDGWSCPTSQAQLNPPGTSSSPFPHRGWSCLSLLPVQVRQRDVCLRAEEDSWEHELAKGNEGTATTRWLMALIWTLLTAQSLGTSAETD